MMNEETKGKYQATFQIGWMTVQAEGDTPEDLVRAVEREQDLQCLAQMAGSMGTKKDKLEVRKLMEFLSKYYDGGLTIEDVRNLDVHLSVGTLKCESLTVSEDEGESG